MDKSYSFENHDENETSIELVDQDIETIDDNIERLKSLQDLNLNQNALISLPKAIGGLKNLHILSLDENQLTSLPDAIGKLKSLQELYLSTNQLDLLPNAIGELRNLQILDLRSNHLTSLPDVIGRLGNLKQLDLDENQLSSLPDVIGRLKSLEILNLGENQLTSLPDAVGRLGNLQTLNLNGNQLTLLSDAIGKLKNLRELYLSENQLASLPDAVGKLKSLETLNLDGNQLTSLPDAIGKLKNLQGLHLSENQLDLLPDAIGELKKLERLDLNGNQLTTLPDAIGELKNLQILYLDENQLTSLPNAMGKLKSLKTLTLSINQLTSLPDAMGELKKLERLDLNENQFNLLPDAVGKLENVEYLDLNENELTLLPDGIGKLESLRELYLSKNQLASLPDAIGRLRNLETLNLNENELISLPDAIGKLKNLQQLYLGENQLTSLPDAVGKLKNVEYLDLNGNQLTSLPDVIGRLKNLQEIHLGDNQLTSLSDAIRNLASSDSFALLDLRDNDISEVGEEGVTLGMTDLREIFEDKVMLDSDTAEAESEEEYYQDASPMVVFKCGTEERRVPLEFCEQRFGEYVRSLIDPEPSGDAIVVSLEADSFEKLLIIEDLLRFDESGEYESMDEEKLLEFMGHAVCLGYTGNMKMLVFGLYSAVLGADKGRFKELLERHEWLKCLFIKAVEDDIDSIYKFGERLHSKAYYPAERAGRLFVWSFEDLIETNSYFFDGRHEDFKVVAIQSDGSNAFGDVPQGYVSHAVFGDGVGKLPEQYLGLEFGNVYLQSWQDTGGDLGKVVVDLGFLNGARIKRLGLGMCSDAVDANSMVTPQYVHVQVKIERMANLKNVLCWEGLDVSEVEFLALLVCTGFKAGEGSFWGLKVLDIIHSRDIDFGLADLPLLEELTSFGCVWSTLRLPRDAGRLKRLWLGKSVGAQSFQVNDVSLSYDLSKLEALHLDAEYLLGNKSIYGSRLVELDLTQRDIFEVTFPGGSFGMSKTPFFQMLDLTKLDTSRLRDLCIRVYNSEIILEDFPALKSINASYCSGPIRVSSALMEDGLDRIEGYCSCFVFEKPAGSNSTGLQMLGLEDCEVEGLEEWNLSDVDNMEVSQ